VGVEASIAGYLTKPVRQSDLYECLPTIIGTPPTAAHPAAA